MSALGLLMAMAGAFCAAWSLSDRRGGASALGADDGLSDLLARIGRWGPVARMREQGRCARLAAACAEGVPEMLDILNLGLSAGLSFDAALDLYCNRFDGELSALMERARLGWGLGLSSRAEALEDLAGTTGVPALSRFASAVSESLEFGTPLASTLEQQANAIRLERKHQVEEAIEKVPVKMLLPMGALVLPAMLVAVLGPILAPALTGLAS